MRDNWLTVAAFVVFGWLGMLVCAADEIKVGEWGGAFGAAKSYSEANNIPMLVFWENPGCTYCDKMKAAIKSANFIEWQTDRKLVMVNINGTDSQDAKDCKAFAKNSSGNFPYMAVYWKANTEGKMVLEKFSGRDREIGHGASSGDALDVQLMTAVDNILSDWKPHSEPVMEGGAFWVPDTAGSRLEAVAGVTRSVSVPLVREHADCVVTNSFRVGDNDAIDIVWDIGETDKSVAVDVASIAVGEDIPLTLGFKDGESDVVFKSAIHGVAEPENSCSNPKFLGEEFGFGEWTFDYDAARELVRANEGAKLLVMFAGPLWCPYCIAMENTLLNRDEFKSWAVANRVVLVLMEQGRASSPATALGQRGPRLTTYVPDPNKFPNEIVSGAAYRSRKGITDVQTEALINRAAEYTARWLAPGSTAARLGNPTILLVNAQDETVAARFNGYRDGMDYDVAENIARLDDLVAHAGKSERNNYAQTTGLTHELGKAENFVLDVTDNARGYRFYPEAGRVDIAVDDTVAASISIAVYRGDICIATGINAVTVIAETGDEETGLGVRVSKAFAAGERTFSGAFSSVWHPINRDNGFVSRAFKLTIPLSDDKGVVTGVVELNATRKGKCTAKYCNAVNWRSVQFGGAWLDVDDFGTVRMENSRGDVSLSIALDSDGVVAVTLRDGKNHAQPVEMSGNACAASIDYADYIGYYAISLPMVSGADGNFTGAGSLTLKANTATFRKTGKVSGNLVLPDMRTATVNGVLQAGTDGLARLTVVGRAGKDRFIVPLAIRSGAANASTHRAVIAGGSMFATWLGIDKKNNPFTVVCDIYGSCLNRYDSLIDCCGTSRLTMEFDWSELEPMSDYGEIVDVSGNGRDIEVATTKFKPLEKIKGLTLAYSRITGIANGKVKIGFASGKKVVAKFKGVFIPDWYDCGCTEDDDDIPLSANMPAVIGTCVFTDKVGGRSASRSIVIKLVNKE